MRTSVLRSVILGLVVMLTSGVIVAHGSPIAVLAEHQISTDTPNEPHAEQVMALNPRDPQNMVAASFVIENARLDDVVYYTKDAGKTWRRAAFQMPERVHFLDSIDPFLTASSDGPIYFIA